MRTRAHTHMHTHAHTCTHTQVVAGANLNVEEAAARVLPKDYGNSQLGGFDPLGLGT